MTSFKERLRSLRRQNNYSQQELADKIKVSKQTISQYERGIREPDFEYLNALCDIFNVSTDYMLGKANVTMRFLTETDLATLSSCDNHALSPDESSLLEDYRQLNSLGKDKAREYVEDLKANNKYLDKEEETSSESTA